MTLFHLWNLPGDVLAAPESASRLDRCNLSLSLSLSLDYYASRICQGMSWQHLHQNVWLDRCRSLPLNRILGLLSKEPILAHFVMKPNAYYRFASNWGLQLVNSHERALLPQRKWASLLRCTVSTILLTSLQYLNAGLQCPSWARAHPPRVRAIDLHLLEVASENVSKQYCTAIEMSGTARLQCPLRLAWIALRSLGD